MHSGSADLSAVSIGVGHRRHIFLQMDEIQILDQGPRKNWVAGKGPEFLRCGEALSFIVGNQLSLSIQYRYFQPGRPVSGLRDHSPSARTRRPTPRACTPGSTAKVPK